MPDFSLFHETKLKWDETDRKKIIGYLRGNSTDHLLVVITVHHTYEARLSACHTYKARLTESITDIIILNDNNAKTIKSYLLFIPILTA